MSVPISSWVVHVVHEHRRSRMRHPRLHSAPLVRVLARAALIPQTGAIDAGKRLASGSARPRHSPPREQIVSHRTSWMQLARAASRATAIQEADATRVAQALLPSERLAPPRGAHAVPPPLQSQPPQPPPLLPASLDPLAPVLLPGRPRASTPLAPQLLCGG